MASKELSNLLVGKDRKSRPDRNGKDMAEDTLSNSASLLDDTLSDKQKKTNWKTPIWIAALVIAASLLVLYFSGSDSPDNAVTSEHAETSRNPQLLEKLVNEAKDAEEDSAKTSSGLQAEPLRQPDSVSPGRPPEGSSAQGRITRQAAAPRAAAASKTAAVSKPSTSNAVPPAARPTAEKPTDALSGPAAQETTRPENMPELIRDVRKDEPVEDTPAESPAAALKTPHQDSFNYLESNSKVAGRLIKGGFSNLNYSKWKVIRETDQEVWIDIEAAWATGGPAIHHIWSVDMTNNKIKALSQAARNLEALNN